jgi:hypothetical protein
MGKDVAEFEAMIVDEEVNVRDMSFFQGMGGRTVISQMIAIAGSPQGSMMHFLPANVPNLCELYVHMTDEVNYCIGPQIPDLTKLASVRITTAENMLIRGICESVEVSTTKLANGKPLLDTNLSGASELCAQSVRYSKSSTKTQLTRTCKGSVREPLPHPPPPSLNVTTECCCFI